MCMTRYDWNKAIHLTLVQPLLSVSWHDRRGGWSPVLVPVLVPVLTLLLPSTRNQWKLFFSLATGCWAGWAGLGCAGLGWGEQDTGGQVRWSAARLVCVLWLCAGLGG